MKDARSSSSPTESTAAAEPSFEESLRRLGDIVEQLERGDLALEASLKLFEEGIRLARTSQARLDEAERRVEELLSVDEKGAPLTKPFEVRLEGATTEATASGRRAG